MAALNALKRGSDLEQFVTTLLAAIAAAVSTAGNLIALCWFGMWMGMTSRTANLATLKTLLFVQIVPALVIYFASSMLILPVMAPYFFKMAHSKASPTSFSWMTWYPLLSAAFVALLSLAKDIGFLLWSRKKLYSSFREQAAHSPGQPRFASRLPVAPAVPTPPVIAFHP